MKLTPFTLTIALLSLLLNPASAEERGYPPAKVDFNDYKALVAEVETHRAGRLIDLDTFLEMARDPDVVILDTRSNFRFRRLHVKGAKHLNFSDFTQENLGRVIPKTDTTVLIYCNNNFDGNQIDFTTKVVLVPKDSAFQFSSPSGLRTDRQITEQEKPLMLALNVPTYINLYGYGYRNVYELNELVHVSDPRITFEGSVVGTRTPAEDNQ